MKQDDQVRTSSTPSNSARRHRRLLWPLAGCAVAITVQAWSGSADPPQSVATAALSGALDPRLAPTEHPAVPAKLEAMWYAPTPSAAPAANAALARLARGAEMLERSGNASEALKLVSDPALARTDLAGYAAYYTGLALQRLNRLPEADEAFTSAASKARNGRLSEAALYRRAEIQEARGNFAGAVVVYEELLGRRLSSPQIALVKLGAAAVKAGNRAKAVEAYRRVIDEFGLTSEAAAADKALADLGAFALDTPEAIAAEFKRGETLFAAGRYDLARTVFSRVRDKLDGEEADRATIRLAQIQAARGQHTAAREVFRRYVGHKTLGPEAQFGVLAAARARREHAEANSLTEAFVRKYPNHPLAEEALYEMARRFVLDDQDGRAAEIYTQMVDLFPAGRHAERGAWKAGWWAYREGNFAETIRIFERGAEHFPRSNYRPAWLYWTARAYDKMGDRERAIARYKLTATDYLNSYYGRLAWSRLEEHNAASVTPGPRQVVETPPDDPPNADLVRSLIAAGLYRAALDELQYAQRMWGNSAPLQATIALVHHRMGNLRPGINAMRQAYPQFMAAGGEQLPEDILRIIFPVAYWSLLSRHAEANGIDPYVLVALAAQESTFDPKIRSSANAIGLLQIIPPTGRRLARQMGIQPFTTRSLENPEINVRLGTRYFASMYKEFGGYHYALAGYNAGEHRVRRWNREAPGLPQDEWVDNIPFPETQNYVKRILGTAEDYRRLYPNGGDTITSAAPASSPRPAATAPAAKAPATKKAPAAKAPAKKTPAKKTTG